MADGFGFSIDWFLDPWKEMQAEADLLTDRATMYAIRAVGRAARAAARAHAPVYKGDDPRAQAESGNLKKSIKSSRRLKHIATGVYELTVMPVGSKKQGTHVQRYGNDAARASTLAKRRKRGIGATTSGQVRGVVLYRRQMEEIYGYMRAGVAFAETDALRIYEEAYKKALEKFA